MEPEYYVSPDGVEQLVSTQAERFRLKYRGWRPKAAKPEPQPVPAPVPLRRPVPKNPQPPTKPAA